MFVVAVSLKHVSPMVMVTHNGWVAWNYWCRYSALRMMTVHKYDPDMRLVGLAECEGQFGTMCWTHGMSD